METESMDSAAVQPEDIVADGYDVGEGSNNSDNDDLMEQEDQAKFVSGEEPLDGVRLMVGGDNDDLKSGDSVAVSNR